MYIAICKNENKKSDTELINVLTVYINKFQGCMELLFKKASKDTCKIPISLYELPHDVQYLLFRLKKYIY